MTFEELKLYATKPGTYRITAIFDGNDEYSAKETTFILIVNEDPDAPPVIIPLPSGGDPEPAVLSFSSNTVEYVQDMDTNKYVLQMPYNPNNLPLVWTCNNNNVIIDLENEEMYIPNIGEYIITVTFSGDSEYQATSASYTIRITDSAGNTVVDKPSYSLYFTDKLIVNYVSSNNTYYFQQPSTYITNDNAVEQEILDLCYYTIGDDPTHLTNGSAVITNTGTYTVYLHFIGNDNYLPQTISYTLNIRETEAPVLDNPSLSFSQQTMTFTQTNVNNSYVLQTLNNPNKVSPIYWSVTSYNSDDIRIYPDNQICYVTKPGTYTITARFNGNIKYYSQSVSYNLVVNAVNQEDAQIYYERLSDEYTISTSIGNGYTVAMPKLVNPFQLPYTISVSTNDIMVDKTGGEYDMITFFQPVKNAVVTASFAGNDIYSPMTSTYTVTLVALANRETPRLYFQTQLEQPEVSNSGVYTIQRIYSPDVPKSSLTWNVTADDGLNGREFWLYEDSEDYHQLYTDRVWRAYTITVSFAGNDNWMPAEASYRLIPLREEEQLELHVEHDMLYFYSFEGSNVYRVKPQPCYLYHNGVNLGEVSVEYTLVERIGTSSFITARGMVYDDNNDEFIISQIGRVYITARFVGNEIYGPAETTYVYYVTTEDNPDIIKKQINMSFNPAVDYVEYDTLEFEYLVIRRYSIPRPMMYVDDPDPSYPSLDDLKLNYNVIFVANKTFRDDAGAIISNENVLLCDGVGVCKITASFDGNQYYEPAEAEYILYIWKEDVAPMDIDLLFGPTDRLSIYNNTTSDNRYIFYPAWWKLSTEPDEYNYWKDWGLDITYSCSDVNATFEFGNDTNYNYITLPSGEGYYSVTATFAGNKVLNAKSASYIIKVGNAEIVERNPELSFTQQVFGVPETYPNCYYPLQQINNPHNIPAEELHWSVVPAEDTPKNDQGFYKQSTRIENDTVYVVNSGYDVIVTVTYNGNRDQFPNTIDIYAPQTVSYRMHVRLEDIVKRDVTISFTESNFTYDKDDNVNNVIEFQTPILSEQDLLLFWTIDPEEWTSDYGNYYTLFDICGNHTITTRYDPYGESFTAENSYKHINVWELPEGNYTITAKFVGDRYRNPAQASYTITMTRKYADVHFEEEIQEFLKDPVLWIYPPYQIYPYGPGYILQQLYNPSNMEITYKYKFENDDTLEELGSNIKIDSFDLSDSAHVGDSIEVEIRAYYTEYNVEKYASYILKITKAKYHASLSFDSNTDILEENWPDNTYRLLEVSSVHKLGIYGYEDSDYKIDDYDPIDINNVVYSISGEGNEIRNGQLYIAEPGTYTVTATYVHDNYYPSTASYEVTINPEILVKQDVTISFAILEVFVDYDLYDNEAGVQIQTPTLSEEVPIVWTINNNGQIIDNKILLDEIGMYTITASYTGDRYHNPASASYTIEFDHDTVGIVRFNNQEVTLDYKDSNIYDLQSPYCEGMYRLVRKQIFHHPYGNIQQPYQLYRNVELDATNVLLEEGDTYQVRLTYTTGHSSIENIATYLLVIKSSVDDISISATMDWEGIHVNSLLFTLPYYNSSNSNYTTRISIIAHNCTIHNSPYRDPNTNSDYIGYSQETRISNIIHNNGQISYPYNYNYQSYYRFLSCELEFKIWKSGINGRPIRTYTTPTIHMDWTVPEGGPWYGNPQMLDEYNLFKFEIDPTTLSNSNKPFIKIINNDGDIFVGTLGGEATITDGYVRQREFVNSNEGDPDENSSTAYSSNNYYNVHMGECRLLPSDYIAIHATDNNLRFVSPCVYTVKVEHSTNTNYPLTITTNENVTISDD